MRDLIAGIFRLIARIVASSRKRLAWVAGGVLVLIVLAALVLGGGKRHPAATPPVVGVTPGATATPSAPPLPDAITVNGQQSIKPEIIGVAKAFITAWTATTVTVPAPTPTVTTAELAPSTPPVVQEVSQVVWLSGITRCVCVTDRLMTYLRTTYPQHVPVSPPDPSSNPEYSGTEKDGTIILTVRCPEYSVTINVQQVGDGYLVNDVNTLA